MNIKMVRIIPDFKNSRYKEIYLAGGCFWGVQAYMDRIPGVIFTEAGYANGRTEETDYYSIDKTGHAETVYVVYDPTIIGLEKLLGYFYEIIDPVSLNRQGNDVGTQYRSGIYYVDESDRAAIETATASVQAGHSEKIATEILPLNNYVYAEDYHQDYLLKNPQGYCHIDLKSAPGGAPAAVDPSDHPKPSSEEIRSKLTAEQYGITQEGNTEYAFKNEYYNNKAEGLYVDIVTGEPLFSSADKYDSGSGWPSFTRPFRWDVVRYVSDNSLGVERIEVRSRSGDSHLGHLFTDGPAAEGGLRYCINSGALEFIAVSDMEARGYGKYLEDFEPK